MASHVACHCCRLLTLSKSDRIEICPVCYWSDDGRGDDLAQIVRGGPNGSLSLGEARRNFVAFGACEVRFRVHVRPARPEEIPANA